MLLDYRAWALENGNHYHACRAPAHRISAADLEKVVKHQGVELRVGDILFLRTGYTEWYNNSDTEERVRVAKQYPPDIVGIEQTEASLRWLWYGPKYESASHGTGITTSQPLPLTIRLSNFDPLWRAGIFTTISFPCGEPPWANYSILKH